MKRRERRAPGNPKGIVASSPTLRQRRYVGLRIKPTHNLYEVAVTSCNTDGNSKTTRGIAALRYCPSTATLDAMSAVVFFRAVNVGGHQTFQPGKLAKELAEFGVVNIGAAGTFVVRENVSQATLRDEILHRLPVKPE